MPFHTSGHIKKMNDFFSIFISCLAQPIKAADMTTYTIGTWQSNLIIIQYNINTSKPLKPGTEHRAMGRANAHACTQRVPPWLVAGRIQQSKVTASPRAATALALCGLGPTCSPPSTALATSGSEKALSEFFVLWEAACAPTHPLSPSLPIIIRSARAKKAKAFGTGKWNRILGITEEQVSPVYVPPFHSALSFPPCNFSVREILLQLGRRAEGKHL